MTSSHTKLRKRRQTRKARMGKPTGEVILDVARELYAHGGYAAVTIRAVAERVGITSGAIYKHFSSKEDLFMELQKRALEMLIAYESHDGSAAPLEHLRLYYWRYYEFSQNNPEYFTMLWVDSSVPSLDAGNPKHHGIARLADDNRSRVERCLAAGLIPPGDVIAIGRYLWTSVHGCAVLQTAHDKRWKWPDEWVAEALDTSLLAVQQGLLPSSSRETLQRNQRAMVIAASKRRLS